MEKKHQDILVVLILWVFTAVFFLLQVSSIWQTAIVVIIYTLMAGISLIVLLFLKSDDAYYQNLTGTYLLVHDNCDGCNVRGKLGLRELFSCSRSALNNHTRAQPA